MNYPEKKGEKGCASLIVFLVFLFIVLWLISAAGS